MTIKRHLVAAPVLFFITGMCLVMILSLRPQQNNSREPVFSGLTGGAEILLSAEVAAVRPISFADELVPVQDRKIAGRLNRALTKHSFENLQTTLLHHKAGRWFPVIEPILAEYGIPQDFKYITLVESGLREGTSPKGARGCWQFMPGTARSFGLTVNRTVDERKNMHKSTIAACKYLRELYAELHSWTLAAAAYNLGDTKLKYQMAGQKQRNYYKMRLNRETAQYVYKLISMKEIIENPSKYGYKPHNEMLAQVAPSAGFPENGLEKRNPLFVLGGLKN